MEPRKTALERAFELARSGKYSSIIALKRDVVGEGYSKDQLEGFALNRQLRTLMRELLLNRNVQDGGTSSGGVR